MASDDVQHRLAAIVSADVVGYSRLMAEDEDATVGTLSACREVIAAAVCRRHGRVVDFTGDNLLAEFPSAVDAVRGAVEIQQALREKNAGLAANRKMEFRVGVHLGDVRVEGERIYGDGVNIAARLEGLAEPAGVCISATVHEQVRNKLDLAYDDLGDRSVKNIAEPVHVFRIRGTAPAAATRQPMTGADRRRGRFVAVLAALAALALVAALWRWPGTLDSALDLAGLGSARHHPPLPDQPSIVVLPFANMSGEPEQEYFSDGITEEVTSHLSGIPELFVSSRNSAFSYKGQPVRVEEIGRALGVRYVLEGSVRKEKDRVRVTAQLIDATTGFHLWSDRYDHRLDDIFALHSEISEKILAALEIEIREAEFERIRRKPTGNLTAYDAYLGGVWHLNRSTRDDLAEARRLFERAIDLDPDYAAAYALLGATYATEYGSGWSRDAKLLDRSEELVERALDIDPLLPDGYVQLASIDFYRGRPQEAVTAARKAVELAPNNEWAHVFLAAALTSAGEVAEAQQAIDRALQLNPRHPSPMLLAVAYVSFAAGRRDEALGLFERVRATNPDLILARIPLASLYVDMGRLADARAAVREVLKVNPDLTAHSATTMIPGLEKAFSAAEMARFEENLHRAGLP